ncbi:MAG: hypothetical protein P9F75_15330 [Candidatus Contendobacter sp.]|nr:hypothetical protein [Candidatus Contendobacter sp.]
MESWPDIPADRLLTMPVALAVPLDRSAARGLASRILEDGTVLIEVESTWQTI